MPDLRHTLLDILFPLSCGGCGTRGNTLCAVCKKSLRSVEASSSCPRCGRWTGVRLLCGDCLSEKRGFTKGYYGFYYEGLLREAIHTFKFKGRKDVGKELTGLLSRQVGQFAHAFDCLVPIPVTERRLKERGFNQSYIIAEEIAAMSHGPILASALSKTKETKDQYSLSREERKGNVRRVFSVTDTGAVKGKRVLLVDDLYTTGRTAAEAAAALTRSGAREVLFFALARTP